MKTSLTSLELTALINELQFLVNSKISQVYHQENQFLFQLHTKEGKQFLRIIPGKFLNLTKTKQAPFKPYKSETSGVSKSSAFFKPSSFCIQLRKLLNNSFIGKIEQKDMERILIFELEKKERFLLIIELFAPGNLILTNKTYQTLACLHQQKFKDRFIKPKERYQFPPPTGYWKTLTESQFQEILQKSQKRNLVTSLATDIGLGGLYAEEICKINGINKNKTPKETSKEEIKLIIQTLKNFLKQTEKPAGYIYEEQITPFLLKDIAPIKKMKTYNEAIDTLIPFELVSPHEKKINAIKRTLAKQEEAAKEFEGTVSLNTKKAELVYQHYPPLKKLLEIVSELKKTKSWEEIKTELEKEKKIKRIDLKNKKIVVDL